MNIPWVILLTIAAYFCLLFYISWLSTRKAGGADSFFTGGRRIPWPVVAIATLGSPISGVTFISVPGMVVTKSFSYLQMALGFIVGYFVIAYVLIPLFYKKKLVSIYGYLSDRFGADSYKTGAWFFFVSKMLGASVRFYVVCLVLQSLVFGPLGIPFVVNVLITIALILLYTARGGVKTVIWTDVLKSICLVGSVVLCIVYVAKGLGLDFGGLLTTVATDPASRIFFFDNPGEGTFFVKQFIGGVFIAIATTGLDQDIMQRPLSCKGSKESQKSMIINSVGQFFLITLFLVLGVLLMLYHEKFIGMEMPALTDELFARVVTSDGMPIVVCILFVLGLVSAAYSAAGSALTALTTSFTVDILGTRSEKPRKVVHVCMAACMGLVICIFHIINNQDAISAVYTLASYTYGPILGLFAFGMMTERKVRDSMVPYVCVLAPMLSYALQALLQRYLGYTVGFELLLLNAGFTMLGLALLIKKDKSPR